MRVPRTTAYDTMLKLPEPGPPQFVEVPALAFIKFDSL
jgi:hypothetical protein